MGDDILALFVLADMGRPDDQEPSKLDDITEFLVGNGQAEVGLFFFGITTSL